MRSLSIIGVAIIVILQLRLSLPGPATDFSTADNPVAKSPSRLTRFLTFLYLPVFNFQLLLYPATLSFDWGMDAIPRLNSLCDSRNLISLIFYSVLAFAVATNVHHLRRRWQLLQSMAHAHYRKPRTIKKRKAFQLPPTNCNNNNGSSCNFEHTATMHTTNYNLHSSSLSTSCNNNNNSSNNAINSSSYLAKSVERMCDVCKQGSAVRHSSSCRAINNNNVPLVRCECPEFRHSPSPPRKRKFRRTKFFSGWRMDDCNHLYAANPLLYTTVSSMVAGSTIPSIGHTNKTTKSSPTKNALSVKSIANQQNNSQRTENSVSSTIAATKAAATATATATAAMIPVTAVASTVAPINDSTTNHLHISHPSTTTSAVIMLSIVFLVLPFVPATNLFFYVGFVVAERILYLPSVGYCLLIGLGVGKLMDTNRTSPRSQRKRNFTVMLCISLTVMMYSVKTINRNADWRDEESLYRSAINVNPPKGRFLLSFHHHFIQ